MSGSWINELGSTMKIKLNKETQNFLGEYCSKVCTDQQSHKGTITGHLLGDLIVFIVRWDSAAITAWVGQVKKRLIKTEEDNGKKEEHKITTLWMMTSKSNGWTPINAGADTFVKNKS
ncbi:avidin/streptavidin family protein [Photorhabdus tasmaniensis]|uniref:avidin/streptavidin family protein n=1 Tax=Photorhabdus tasmaniensis TaxID=1004159 RepID=UPI004042DE0B